MTLSFQKAEENILIFEGIFSYEVKSVTDSFEAIVLRHHIDSLQYFCSEDDNNELTIFNRFNSELSHSIDGETLTLARPVIALVLIPSLMDTLELNVEANFLFQKEE